MRQKRAFGTGSVLFVFSAILGVFSGSLTGCSGEGGDPITPVDGHAQTLGMHAQFAFEQSTPVAPQDIAFSVQLNGEGFYSSSSVQKCAALDHHMPAKLDQTLAIDSTGSVLVRFAVGDLSALVDSSCKVTEPATLALGDGMIVTARIPANQDNCTAYCTVHSPGDATRCYADCINGDRQILASHSYSKDDLIMLGASENQDHVVELQLDLVFDHMSEGISATSGPDLRVSEYAIRQSLSVSTRNFSKSDCAIVEQCVGGTGDRRLLRFDGVIENLGDQDFHLGSPIDSPLFQYSACHGHYHLKAAMRYELINPKNGQVVTLGAAQVVGRKQGFCMLDMQQLAGSNPSKFTCSDQGLTSGWADIYNAGLDCQWIDITGVPAGDYKVRVTVNPEGILPETDKTNNWAEVPISLSDSAVQAN